MSISSGCWFVSYILVTNIYNEGQRVKKLVENIANQTLRPIHWVWIDDGSTDDGLDIAIGQAKKFGLSIVPFKIAPKKKGNLDTIGRAWNKAHRHIITELSADYLSVADVDTEFPLDYFENMIDFMEAHPDVGVSSGRIKGDSYDVLKVPMGGGKIVRWDILFSFDKYWDLAPDSFFNIKAQSLGYRLAIREEFVKSPPMTILSEKGRYRYGQRSYYIGKNFMIVLLEGLKFLVFHQYGSQFLRGYWFEWSRARWRCDDEAIRYFFSLKRQIHLFLKRLKFY